MVYVKNRFSKKKRPLINATDTLTRQLRGDNEAIYTGRYRDRVRKVRNDAVLVSKGIRQGKDIHPSESAHNSYMFF